MSFKSKEIIMTDWAGNRLFIGDYDDPRVDEVLEANRCKSCEGSGEGVWVDNWGFLPHCLTCLGSGYIGDFEVVWHDESDKDNCNVYEYINY